MENSMSERQIEGQGREFECHIGSGSLTNRDDVFTLG
jgi:hypothetical protein